MGLNPIGFTDRFLSSDYLAQSLACASFFLFIRKWSDVGLAELSWGLQCPRKVSLSSLFSYPECDWRFLYQFSPSQMQSFASVNAKHCIRQRKTLQLPMQSFATANAKLSNRQRKALHLPSQSFASANAKHCLHLGDPFPWRVLILVDSFVC